MRNKFTAACAVVSLTLFSALAFATTNTTTATPDAATLANTDLASVPVWPKAATTLPTDQQAVATTFSLGQVDGIDPKLISGVTANGYARKVDVEGKSIGQILVMSVAKGDKTEVISSEGLTAQFDASETSELFPEKSMTVEGSKTALVSALEKLNATEETDDEKKAVADDTQDNAVGSSGSNNDLASGYSSPTNAATATEEEDPTLTTALTTDGCKVRVDIGKETAFQQSKTQTFSDGVLSSESACSDSDVSYLLKKSYLACDDVVELDAMTAWPQYTWYYADDQGETHTVSDCTKDTDQPFTISEDEGQCSILFDFTAGTATPQSALIYSNRTGAVVQARGCDTSTLSTPITMTESTSECSLRHNYTTGKSYELSMWTYIRGGVTYQASSCNDTGRTFVHETIYTDTAGEYVCSPVVNQAAGTVTLQSRKRITIDGVSQYITECTPDTSTLAITATTDGCMDPSKWIHDLDTNTSYGQERFYYLKGGTTPVYVTSCQTSATTYTHDHAVTGYQYHDDELYAYPLTTVTISVNGSPYTIASSEVLPGAQQFVYTLNGTVDKQNGAATYEGCNAYYTTLRYEQWERPDATIYEKVIGDGDPVGPSDVCSTTQESNTHYKISVSGFTASGSTVWSYTGSCSGVKNWATRTVRKNPVTGDVFSSAPEITGTQDASSGFCIHYSDCDGSGEYCKDEIFAKVTPSGTAFYDIVGYGQSPCGTTPIHLVSGGGGTYVLTCGWSPESASAWR
ncbi:MAG: hypothetical protein JXQ84_06455 [Rhodospirillaceae bacterium]|nr:hypothetical protein [Rhodospirillaceae bacterium]